MNELVEGRYYLWKQYAMASKMPMIVVDERLHEWGLPAYGTPFSAGLDLRACIDEPLTLNPDQCVLVSTGVKFDIPAGVAGFLSPKSGKGHKQGLVLGNLTGIIDEDYQGVVKASLWNRSTTPILIQPGDEICQIVFQPYVRMMPEIVSEFEHKTERGEGGFGSTDRPVKEIPV